MGFNDELIFLPNELLDQYQSCEMSICEMENDFKLGVKEWCILRKIRLSRREKECVYLYYWRGFNTYQIANKLGVERPVVSIYLSRARHKIYRWKYGEIGFKKMYCRRVNKGNK